VVRVRVRVNIGVFVSVDGWGGIVIVDEFIG